MEKRVHASRPERSSFGLLYPSPSTTWPRLGYYWFNHTNLRRVCAVTCCERKAAE
jgi:hypothetical protein